MGLFNDRGPKNPKNLLWGTKFESLPGVTSSKSRCKNMVVLRHPLVSKEYST